MTPPSNSYFPLTMARPGERVRLVEIDGGRRLRHRLTELGLTPGVELQVVQDEGGPLLLAVHDSRLALGRCMAHKILVQRSRPALNSPAPAPHRAMLARHGGWLSRMMKKAMRI